MKIKEFNKDAYGGYILDDIKNLESSSGGVATAISEKFIQEGGYVAGVRYTDDFYSAKYELTKKYEDIQRFKGSKYFNFNKQNIFAQVKSKLESGEKVLFFGVPCSNYALKKFLQKDYENLFIVELICHGYTFEKVHKEYVENLEKKYKSKVVDFSVRKKINLWGDSYIYAKFKNGEEFKELFVTTEYGYAFGAAGLPCCYSCEFKRKSCDLIIGDFWGADEEDDFWNEKGVSAIIVNTQKGNELLKKTDNLKLFTTNVDRIYEKNHCLIDHREPLKETEKFIKLFKKHDLFYSVKHSRPFISRLKHEIYDFLPETLAIKLKKIFFNK